MFAWRLERVAAQIEASEYLAKFSGATGTWSAHLAAEPDVDWPELVALVHRGPRPRLQPADDPDRVARLAGRAVRPRASRRRHPAQPRHRHLDLHLDRLLHADPGRRRDRLVDDAAQDQPDPVRERRGEPRDRRAACSRRSSQTLVTSRLQRDLTDSTTQRNIGVAFGHSLLALDNLQRGLGEISLAEDVLLADLDANWEVLAEAIQTVVRAEIAAGRSHDHRPLRAAEGPHPRSPRRRAPSSPSSCAGSTSGMPRRSACSRSRPPPTPAWPRTSFCRARRRAGCHAPCGPAGSAGQRPNSSGDSAPHPHTSATKPGASPRGR